MGRVGSIDITVGNAARLGASQRSTTRRCASHHIATQRESRWDIPAALARLARTLRLKRSRACGSETVWRSRAMPYRGLPTRLNSLCAWGAGIRDQFRAALLAHHRSMLIAGD